MKIRCTNLSDDSGTPWFICHLNRSLPRKDGTGGMYIVTYTAYATSLLKAKIAVAIKAFFGKPDKND